MGAPSHYPQLGVPPPWGDPCLGEKTPPGEIPPGGPCHGESPLGVLGVCHGQGHVVGGELASVPHCHSSGCCCETVKARRVCGAGSARVWLCGRRLSLLAPGAPVHLPHGGGSPAGPSDCPEQPPPLPRSRGLLGSGICCPRVGCAGLRCSPPPFLAPSPPAQGHHRGSTGLAHRARWNQPGGWHPCRWILGSRQQGTTAQSVCRFGFALCDSLSHGREGTLCFIAGVLLLCQRSPVPSLMGANAPGLARTHLGLSPRRTCERLQGEMAEPRSPLQGSASEAVRIASCPTNAHSSRTSLWCGVPLETLARGIRASSVPRAHGTAAPAPCDLGAVCVPRMQSELALGPQVGKGQRDWGSQKLGELGLFPHSMPPLLSPSCLEVTPRPSPGT